MRRGMVYGLGILHTVRCMQVALCSSFSCEVGTGH